MGPLRQFCAIISPNLYQAIDADGFKQ